MPTQKIQKQINTQKDHAKDLDNVMPMYNSIQQSDNYAKTSVYFNPRDEPALDNNVAIIDIAD